MKRVIEYIKEQCSQKMKKLLLIVSVLSLVSCEVPIEERIAAEERLKELHENFLTNCVHKVDYEGHTYLLLDSYVGYYSMCHDENCKCKSKK